MERQKEDGMKTVVITGSTRGIGFGLADEFLKRDCQVVINGRSGWHPLSGHGHDRHGSRPIPG